MSKNILHSKDIETIRRSGTVIIGHSYHKLKTIATLSRLLHSQLLDNDEEDSVDNADYLLDAIEIVCQYTADFLGEEAKRIVTIVDEDAKAFYESLESDK